MLTICGPWWCPFTTDFTRQNEHKYKLLGQQPQGKQASEPDEQAKSRTNLNEVLTIRSSGTLSGITRLTIATTYTIIMGIGSRPLNMHEISRLNNHTIRHKIIFDRRVRLHDIATF